MTAVLTVFIDGLPFDQLEKMPFARALPSRARLTPVLGYSVNCQTQLFTGKTPDELGFYCEWEFAPETTPFRSLRIPLALASAFEGLYFAKRVMHRLLDKFGPVGPTKNIPLRYLPLFDKTGHEVFSPEFGQPSLLDHPGVTKFLHHQFPNSDRLDEEIFLAAKQYIDGSEKPGHVFLTLVKIDQCSHWEGVDSEPYDRMLLENDRYLRELSEVFLAKEPEGTVLVVSDHGMTNITEHVHFDLESRFGRPAADRYAYFSDGTILRVWTPDPALLVPIREYLDGIAGLERLSEAERRDQGLTRPEFGDLIYHTPAGTQIVPSFWGPKPSLGMHGHHPRYPGQHGVCLSNREDAFPSESLTATQFHGVLSDFLG